MTFRSLVIPMLVFSAFPLLADDASLAGPLTDPQGKPVLFARLASKPPQVSGTVVDTSGALIAGATVQILNANGILQTTTQSDRNGSFIIAGLSAGDYRLVVSNPGFETNDIPVTIGTTDAPAPLRI